MFRRLCNVIIRALLPHSDYSVSGDGITRALAILELSQALAHTHDAIAFLGARPGRQVTRSSGQLTRDADRPAIRRLPVDRPGVSP